MSELPTHPDPAKWWKHMRYLAYAAMLALFIILGLIFFLPEDQIVPMIPLIQTMIWAFTGIIFSYIGFTVAEHTMAVPKVSSRDG